MWIVRLALGRPYTFVVMAVLIAILGGAAIATMPVDIFPYIDIPVVSVVWVYSGLGPEEMEKRVATGFERSLTSNVNDIEHIESQSYNGYSVVKVYFHPNVKIDMAVAQVTATMETALRQMPPGMFPANVLKYDASSVPILQLGLSSKTLSEQEIFDLGNNFIRTPLGTVQGASVSYPFGGKQRGVMVDLNLDELYAKQLSPIDVSNALNLQNLILPAGTAKIAETEYQVRVNSSPILLDDLNNLPIKTVNGATVYIKDVAQVHDGYSVQNNIVRTNGARGVLITITRNGKASTLSIVNAVKAALPRILANVPPELKVVPLADQSVFVRASIQGVVREALIAAGLTGLMILLFLGSWRSTLIVCISIPLSILTSLVHPEPAGTDHQRDDAGRPGAGGRHSGGRCDGGDRKYASQHRDAKAACSGGAGWRIADRGAHLRRHPLDLHRVRAGSVAHRHGADSCLRRSPWPWFSPCSLPTCCRARWFPP